MLLTLAKGLRERGHHVVPVGPADGCGWLADQFRNEGFEPETFVLKRAVDVGCVRGLANLFERHRIDVVHSHEFSMAVYGAMAALVGRRRHVITLHGSRYFARHRRRRIILRLAVQSAWATVAVSDDLAMDMSRDLNLSPEKITVIRNGQELPKGSRSTFREELGIADHDVLIVAVGSLYPVKGHSDLLEALRLVLDRSNHPSSIHLVIAGREGSASQGLRHRAETLVLTDSVHILGHRDDIPNVLAGADIFCLPSLSEGFPLALIEAMGSATAIVATSVGGVPTAIRDGIDGILVPPGNPLALATALLRLINDQSTRCRLGGSASVRAGSLFSLSAMIDAYESIYSSSERTT